MKMFVIHSSIENDIIYIMFDRHHVYVANSYIAFITWFGHVFDPHRFFRKKIAFFERNDGEDLFTTNISIFCSMFSHNSYVICCF